MSVGTKTSSVSGRKGLEMMTEKETLAHLARRASRLSSKLVDIAARYSNGRRGNTISWYSASQYAWLIYYAGKAMGEAEGYLHALETRKYIFGENSNNSQKSAQ